MIKFFFANSVAVVIKMVSLFGLNKIIAIYAGPNAYAYISQLQNIINALLVLPSNAVNNGVVKYTAEFNDDIHQQRKIWKTATFMSMVICCFISGFMFIFSGDISVFVFGSEQYKYVFDVFSVTIFFNVFNSFILSFINGLMKIKEYVVINVITNLMSLLFSAVLIYYFSLKGALLSLVINQAIVVLFSVFFAKKTSLFKISNVIGLPYNHYVKKILKFSIIPITSGLTLPVALTIVRNIIISKGGWVEAGYWDSIIKMSNLYLMLITTTFNVYLLPKLSSLKSKNDIIHEIKNTTKVVFLISIMITVFIFLFKVQLIRIIFSDKFLPVTSLLGWQLVGDVFKMLAWIFGFFIMSKSYVLIYVATEMFQWISYVALVFMLYDFHLVDVIFSYAVNQILYFVVMVASFFYIMKYKYQSL